MGIGTIVQPAEVREHLAPAAAPAMRVRSLDIIRGVVMVLMAIDHVRVYSGIPAGSEEPAVFLTRWITHFCAPAFVFFAGTAAYFNGRKLGDTQALSRFLLVRGALLVLLELTAIKFFWTFRLDYSGSNLAGVIWMLGWCMIILAGLVRLAPRTVGWIGVAIVAFQQVLGLAPAYFSEPVKRAIGPAWEFIYSAGLPWPPHVTILYVIVPWIGVMAAGYGFGPIVEKPARVRDRLLVRIGLAATAVFLVWGSLRAASLDRGTFLVRLLGQQKYPASHLFLLMTLGPTIALLPLAERTRGRLADGLAVIGRAPLFYYLAHIPLIHLSALLVNRIRTGAAHPEWYLTAPGVRVPETFRWPLPLLYLIFAVDVALLYALCKWFEQMTRSNPHAWMRYL